MEAGVHSLSSGLRSSGMSTAQWQPNEGQGVRDYTATLLPSPKYETEETRVAGEDIMGGSWGGVGGP